MSIMAVNTVKEFMIIISAFEHRSLDNFLPKGALVAEMNVRVVNGAFDTSKAPFNFESVKDVKAPAI